MGHTDISAGNGDMMVWASKGGRYGFAKVAFGKDKNARITLNHDMKDAALLHDTLDVTPPAENTILPAEAAETVT